MSVLRKNIVAMRVAHIRQSATEVFGQEVGNLGMEKPLI